MKQILVNRLPYILYNRFCLWGSNFVNFVRHCELADFNSTVTLIPLFQLSGCSACVRVLCLVIFLPYVSLQVLQRMYISASFAAAAARVPTWKALPTSFITAMVQHSNNSTKHPSKCGILWLYSLLWRILLQTSLHVQDSTIFNKITGFDYWKSSHIQ